MTLPEPIRNDRELVLEADGHHVVVPGEAPVLTVGLARALVKLALHLHKVGPGRVEESPRAVGQAVRSGNAKGPER